MNVAATIEHTRLAADTRSAEIETLCAEAVRYGFAGVCVNPVFIARAREWLGSSTVKLVSVVGFPLGAGIAEADAHEAELCLEHGAGEIDMVAPLAAALDADFNAVERHVAMVRRACGDRVLKVILETGFFADAALESLARAAIAGGADFLKTSTGFGPRGAEPRDVQLLANVARAAGGRVRVKASGGIRSLEQARQLLTSGAARLGTSSGVAIARAEAGAASAH